MNDLARLTVEDRGDLRFAEIAGEVDASNAVDVKIALMADLPNASHGLVADMRRLDYLDSSGIAVLFELADRLARRGQKLAIVVSPEALVRPTLELTGVASVAELASTPEEAQERVRASGG